MIKIKKDFSFKTLIAIVSVLALSRVLLYASPFPSDKQNLRLTIGTEDDTYDRIGNVLSSNQGLILDTISLKGKKVGTISIDTKAGLVRTASLVKLTSRTEGVYYVAVIKYLSELVLRDNKGFEWTDGDQHAQERFLNRFLTQQSIESFRGRREKNPNPAFHHIFYSYNNGRQISLTYKTDDEFMALIQPAVEVITVGYGAIGSNVARELRKAGYITKVFDIDRIKARQAEADNFETIYDLDKYLEQRLVDKNALPIVITDCAPNKVGAENKDKIYSKYSFPVVYQGGERIGVADRCFSPELTSFDSVSSVDSLRVQPCSINAMLKIFTPILKKYAPQKIKVYTRAIRDGKFNEEFTPYMPYHHIKTYSNQLELYAPALLEHLEGESVAKTDLDSGYHWNYAVIETEGITSRDVKDLLRKDNRLALIELKEGFIYPDDIMASYPEGTSGITAVQVISLGRDKIGIFYIIPHLTNIVPPTINAVHALTKVFNEDASYRNVDRIEDIPRTKKRLEQTFKGKSYTYKQWLKEYALATDRPARLRIIKQVSIGAMVDEVRRFLKEIFELEEDASMRLYISQTLDELEAGRQEKGPTYLASNATLEFSSGYIDIINLGEPITIARKEIRDLKQLHREAASGLAITHKQSPEQYLIEDMLSRFKLPYKPQDIFNHILIDLVSNAMRYSHAKGPVGLEVSLFPIDREDLKKGGILKITTRQTSSTQDARKRLMLNKDGFDNKGGPDYLIDKRRRLKEGAALQGGVGLSIVGYLMKQTDVRLIYMIGTEDPFPIETRFYISLAKPKTMLASNENVMDEEGEPRKRSAILHPTGLLAHGIRKRLTNQLASNQDIEKAITEEGAYLLLDGKIITKNVEGRKSLFSALNKLGWLRPEFTTRVIKDANIHDFKLASPEKRRVNIIAFPAVYVEDYWEKFLEEADGEFQKQNIPVIIAKSLHQEKSLKMIPGIKERLEEEKLFIVVLEKTALGQWIKLIGGREDDIISCDISVSIKTAKDVINNKTLIQALAAAK